MKEITKCITLDLQRRGNTRMIFARQNDMLSRQIRIALTAGGVSYPVPKDTVALLNILRADGESAAFAAEITDDGEIEITLSLWMLSSAGETRCSVSLIDSDGRTLTSEDFTLDVLETLYEGSDVMTDENYSLFTALMADMAEIKLAELERVEKENSRILAEQKREEAFYAAMDAMGNAKTPAKNVSLEDEGDKYASENVEDALSEINKRFGNVQNEVDQLYENCNALYGKGGSLILPREGFNEELKITATISGLGEQDMVSFGPASAFQQTVIANCGLYLISPSYAEEVVFCAKELPEADIELVYFIIRGSV